MTEQIDEQPQQKENEKWHRLSLVSIIYYLVKIFKQLINNALPSLAPLLIVILNSDNKVLMLVSIVAVLLALLLLTSFLQYWFFRYRLTASEVLINQGVFKKEHRVINFDRVQNININQPFYFKPFKLVSLVIDTAGSSSGEGALAGIGTEQAETIRDTILLSQSQQKSQTTQQDEEPLDITPEQEQPSEVLATAELGDSIRFGLANNSGYFLLALMAPFYKTIQQNIAAWIGEENITAWFDLFSHKAIGIIVMVLLVFVTVIFLVTVVSVVGAILNYHNYRLTLQDKTLKRSSGLLNTHEESLNLQKVQALVRHKNMIARMLGRENLILRQTSSGQSNQQPSKKASQFLVPSRTAQQSLKLIAEIAPNRQEPKQTFGISQRYVLKTWLVNFGLPIVIFSSPFIWFANKPELMFGWGIMLIFLPLIYLRWRKYRYGITSEYGYIQTGLFGYRRVDFPLFKVQRVSISQSLLQKRKGLANLTIYLASGPMTIPYMPISHARQWFDEIYYKIETDQRPWF